MTSPKLAPGAVTGNALFTETATPTSLGLTMQVENSPSCRCLIQAIRSVTQVSPG